MDQPSKKHRRSGSYTVPKTHTAASKSTYSESVKIERAVKKALEKETPVGHVDQDAVTYGFDTTGTLHHVNPIPGGSGVDKRTEQTVSNLGLQIRGRVENAVGASTNHCALILILDKKPNGSTPPITAILKSVSSVSLNQQDGKVRFRVLRRWDFAVCGNPTVTETPASTGGVATANKYENLQRNTLICVDEYVSLKGITSKWKDANAADTAMTENCLYLLSVGDNASGNSAAAGTLSSRLRFLDK